MKRIIVSLLMLISVVGMYATDFKYLILEAKDGKQTCVAISGVKIGFAGGVMSVTNAEGGNWQFSIDNMAKFYFTENDDTAVESVFAEGGEQGIAVYDIDGKLVGRFLSQSQMENTLKKGVYIIKNKDSIKKQMVK